MPSKLDPIFTEPWLLTLLAKGIEGTSNKSTGGNVDRITFDGADIPENSGLMRANDSSQARSDEEEFQEGSRPVVPAIPMKDGILQDWLPRPMIEGANNSITKNTTNERPIICPTGINNPHFDV